MSTSAAHTTQYYRSRARKGTHRTHMAPSHVLALSRARAPFWPRHARRRLSHASSTSGTQPAHRERFDSTRDRREAPPTRRARASRRPSVRRHPCIATHTRRTLRDAADAALDAADGAQPAWRIANRYAHRVVHRQVPVGEGGDAKIRSGAGHSMAAAPKRRRTNRAPKDLVARGDGSTVRAAQCWMQLNE